MKNDRIQLLQSMPIFGGIDEEVLVFLLRLAESRIFGKGQYLFRENEVGQSMMVLEEGEVLVSRRWEEEDYILGRLGVGDCVGEMSLLDLFPRSATVMATKKCITLELSHGVFYQLRQKNVSQFATVQLNIAREVCRRLRATDEKLFATLVSANLIEENYPLSAT